MREWQGKGAKVSLCVLGTKGLHFFRRLPLPIAGQRDRAWATGRTSRT